MKKSSFYHLPLHSTPPWAVRGVSVGISAPLLVLKSRIVSLPDGGKISKACRVVFEIYAVVRFTPLRGRRTPGGADRGVPSTEMD